MKSAICNLQFAILLEKAWRAFPAALLLLFVLSAALGPLLSPFPYWERTGPPLLPPGRTHLLGTDELGRDVLVRLLYAGRTSLAIGFAAAFAAACAGTAVGFVAGMGRPWVDGLLMRLADAFLALPALPVLLVLAAVDLAGPLESVLHSLGRDGDEAAVLARSPAAQAARLVVIVALFGWMGSARLVRAQVLSLRERPFVLAARAAGVGTVRICLRHLLPHCLGPVLVATAVAVGGTILYEAVLGFLGLGVPPPTPTWGGMLQSARAYSGYRAPWLIYFPGLCITVTVLCVNVLADRLQERADVRRG